MTERRLALKAKGVLLEEVVAVADEPEELFADEEESYIDLAKELEREMAEEEAMVDEATGRGAYLVIRDLARAKGLDPKETRVAVQGFGNAGYHVARLLHFDGYRIVAVSDSKGAIYSEDGFDVESLYRHKQETRALRGVYSEGSVDELVDHKSITNEELLELDVELLIPSALENVITQQNADRIRAPLIVEVANGPITGDADASLFDRGIQVVPDVLANAGGVTVSYFEWVQNRAGYYWTLEDVRGRLEEIMTRAFTEVWELAEGEKRSLRSAAYANGLRRIEEGALAHGSREYFSNSDD